MKDSCIITECSHQATQFKKIHNVLSVLYTDKGFKHVNNIIHKNKELDKVKHFPVYPDASKWLRELNVEINTVDPNALLDIKSGLCPIISILTIKTHIFDANLQKQRL